MKAIGTTIINEKKAGQTDGYECLKDRTLYYICCWLRGWCQLRPALQARQPLDATLNDTPDRQRSTH